MLFFTINSPSSPKIALYGFLPAVSSSPILASARTTVHPFPRHQKVTREISILLFQICFFRALFANGTTFRFTPVRADSIFVLICESQRALIELRQPEEKRTIPLQVLKTYITWRTDAPKPVPANYTNSRTALTCLNQLFSHFKN